MTHDIKKPEALIKEEGKIRAKYEPTLHMLDAEYAKKCNAVEAIYSKKYYANDAQRVAGYSEADIKKSEIYSESEPKRAAVSQKYENEVKALWPQHGWSQANENAFVKQEAAKAKAAQLHEAKPHAKAAVESALGAQQKKDVVAAMHASGAIRFATVSQEPHTPLFFVQDRGVFEVISFAPDAPTPAQRGAKPAAAAVKTK